jgi:hypothetical protein
MKKQQAPILDASIISIIGLMWLGYAAGLAVHSDWWLALIFFALGWFWILWGEGVRLYIKRHAQ